MRIHTLINPLLKCWFGKKFLAFSTAKVFKVLILSHGKLHSKIPRTYFKPPNRGFKTLTDGNFSLLQKLYFLADKQSVSSPVELAAGARLISKTERVVSKTPKLREKISFLDQTSRRT